MLKLEVKYLFIMSESIIMKMKVILLNRVGNLDGCFLFLDLEFLGFRFLVFIELYGGEMEEVLVLEVEEVVGGW